MYSRGVRPRFSLACLLLVACGEEPGIDYGDPRTDPQQPPRGMDAIEVWLASGYHHSWSCEPAPRAAMPDSPHGAARVCSNALLATASGATLPVGVATVKEIYEGDELVGHAVSRKVTDAGLDGWYWYELHSGGLHADGMNVGSCPGCHQFAADELTFVIVR
jgi:hypothetical protein